MKITTAESSIGSQSAERVAMERDSFVDVKASWGRVAWGEALVKRRVLGSGRVPSTQHPSVPMQILVHDLPRLVQAVVRREIDQVPVHIFITLLL